jgi:hypothetical protein
MCFCNYTNDSLSIHVFVPCTKSFLALTLGSMYVCMCELGRFVVGLAVASDGLLRWQKKGIVFEGGGPDGNTFMHTYIHTYIHTYMHTYVLKLFYLDLCYSAFAFVV